MTISKVGKLDGALSRHANEILAGLVENEVELVFRALSDVDRERRVIRRSLLFGQLQAETGIEEQELCGLLDPFRADDCSFLTPSASRQKSLKSDTRIDVGHEALLRRWSASAAQRADQSENAAVGGARRTPTAQTYRNLLFMLETGAQTLPLDIVDKNAAWWKERCRTPDWAKRYGGRYEVVERLIADSVNLRQAEKIRLSAEAAITRRNRRLKRIALVAIPALAVSAGIAIYVWRQETNAEATAKIAEATAKVASTVVDQFGDQVNRILALRDDGAITVDAAQQLFGIDEKFVKSLPGDQFHY